MKDVVVDPKCSQNSMNLKKFACAQDFYELIYLAHIESGHNGIKRMKKKIDLQYCNIPREAIEMFKPYCVECELKSNADKRVGFVLNPIIVEGFNLHTQVDLIDLQSKSYKGFKFIMN